MSAVYSLPLKIVGVDICEQCFLRDECTEYKDKRTERVCRVCFDCMIKKMNSSVENGELKKLNVNGRDVEIAHIQRGTKRGEAIVFEKLGGTPS